MKILVIGGTGTIGSAVVKLLVKRHDIIIAGSKSGDVQLNITDEASIVKMFKSLGKVDAVISTTGKVHFAPITEMTSKDYSLGLNNKLMGQINLVIQGLPFLNDAGSFTLTSGILSNDPIRHGSSAAMVNGAIDGFVKAAAIEMPRGIRINSISPTILSESIADIGDYFLGFDPVPAAKVALAYSKSVEGAQTGQVYRVGYC